MPNKVLITGGSGFIGRHLQQTLKAHNYEVAILSRNPPIKQSAFHWDIDKGEFDTRALEQTNTIIHLAGANIGGRRWTEKRKKEIIESRTKSAEFLFEKLSSTPHKVKTFISASAIGIYGDGGDECVDENHPHGTNFLATTCEQWEAAARKIESVGIRVVILRFGIVLAADGGALPVMAKPVKLFVGAPLASGQQYLSWIHIDDLCGLMIFAMEKQTMKGVYNGVTSNSVTNKEFTKQLGYALHRPVWPFSVPSIFLKLILGEMATMIIEGQRVSNKKILAEGFNFKFQDLKTALTDIY